MRTNLEKVMERDAHMTELNDRSSALQMNAMQFATQSSQLKRKYWWKNLKMWIIIGTVCTVLLILIIGVSVGTKNDDGEVKKPIPNSATNP